MRRDAAENRQRLIEAAREIMREHGGDVALEMIAERAGISRGTVYRNFEDRIQLYEAVLEADLDTIRTELQCPQRRADLFEVMRRLVELMAVYDKFRGSLPHLSDFRGDGCQFDTMLAMLTTDLSIKTGMPHQVKRQVIAGALMTTAMAFVLSGFFSALEIGLTSEWPVVWLKSFVLG